MSAVVAIGGAGIGSAGTRTIDPFTISSLQSPAQLGKHLGVSINFTNRSVQTVTQATLTVTASNGATFAGGSENFTANRGTCAPDPNNPGTAICTIGHLESGANVAISLRFNSPPVSSGATQSKVSTTLTINESGNPADPGSISNYHPTGDPLSIPLTAGDQNDVADLLGVNGGTANTAPVTKANSKGISTNPTSTSITTPGIGSLEPVTISEGANDPSICGGDATPLLDTSTISAPGLFNNGAPLKVVLDGNATTLPGENRLKVCHNGAALPPNCPTDLSKVPTQGCVQSLSKVMNENGVWVERAVVLSQVNGKIGYGGI